MAAPPLGREWGGAEGTEGEEEEEEQWAPPRWWEPGQC